VEGLFAYMATLWEMMVFSLSSKFWKTSGLRTLWTPVADVRRLFRGMAETAGQRGVNRTVTPDLVAS
jgi:hypothetical protein